MTLPVDSTWERGVIGVTSIGFPPTAVCLCLLGSEESLSASSYQPLHRPRQCGSGWQRESAARRR